MKEIWKDIPNYGGLYQISNTGKIKSLNYNRTHKEKVLKPMLCYGNYYTVTLYKNKIKEVFLVHRLVALTYIQNSQKKEYVNHKDGNKLNNNVNNLEWVTPSENNIHAFKMGLNKSPTKGKFGKDNHLSKKVYQLNKENAIINCFFGLREAERITGINHVLISRCCKNKIKTAGGYKWKYVENEIILN